MPKKSKKKVQSNVNLVKCPKCGWKTDVFGDTFICGSCGHRMTVKSVKQKMGGGVVDEEKKK